MPATTERRFDKGDRVEKIGGRYGGPGVIMEVIELEPGVVTYVVAYKIEGGWGRLLLLHTASNLVERAQT